MTALTRYEMETVINFNAGEETASVYTRDKAVMRRLDKLVESHPDTYRLEKQDEVSKTYSMPKSCVTYRKPRNLTDEQREQARERLQKIKNADK